MSRAAMAAGKARPDSPTDPTRRSEFEDHDSRSPQRDADATFDEKELVDRARAGDADAFRGLFQRYQRRAYSLAYSVLHNADDALDVVQEGFIKAHRYLDRFEGNSTFYTWLYRIIMNLSIDHLRRNKRARHVDFDDTFGHAERGESQGDEFMPRILGQNPSKSLARKRIREQIAAALDTLSDNHRAVLLMREVDGMSYEEMAQAMKCSKGTIMSRLFHARKNMQKELVALMGGEKDLEA